MNSIFHTINDQIREDPMNAEMHQKWYEPVYTVWPNARIVIVGQAPGRKAQESRKPWNDPSGVTLRKWLNITDEVFYDPNIVALMPMDFYFPGKGSHGDLPPRKGFAEKWHPILLPHMPHVELIILVGAYSQRYYLGKNAKANLTETVRSYGEYLPRYFPLVHSSPLNFRWRTQNPWFEREVVPVLAETVKKILDR